LLHQPVSCPKCHTVFGRTGTIVLTAPSLVLLAGTMWIGTLRQVSPWVLMALVLINGGTVIFLLPYFARLEAQPVKPNAMR